MGTIKTPEDAEQASQYLWKVFELEDVIEDCKNDYLVKAESAKDAKKQLEAAQEALNRFIRGLKQKLPLFDRPEPVAAVAEVPAADAWREVPLRTALEGLPDSIFDAMEEEFLFNMGNLCEWRKEFRLVDLNGVGPAKVTKIEDALERFWGEWAKEHKEPESAVTASQGG